jgi:hypothetical protein
MGLWDFWKTTVEDGLSIGKELIPGYEMGKDILGGGERAVAVGLGWLEGDSPANLGCELITTKNCSGGQPDLKDALLKFPPGSNPFNCYYTFKGKPLRTHDGADGKLIPLKADCNTVAWISALGLLLGVCLVGLMSTAILLELGMGVAPIMEFFLQVIEFLTMGLSWVFSLWEWIFTQMVVVIKLLAEGTGVNVVLLLVLGVEAMVALTIMLLHSTLRLYWSFHESIWYSTFEWLNTPIRYVLDQWLMPNVGLFLTGVVEVIIFFPVELPLLVVALLWGTIMKVKDWFTGEYNYLKGVFTGLKKLTKPL